MRTANYSTFLSRISGLIGVARSDLQDEEKSILNGFFNHSIQSAWESSNWIDLTAIGEARFVGNLIPYANAYTVNGASWSTSALTVTDNVLANPMDSRVTAATFFETAANSGHQIQTPSITALPGVQYQFQVYVRAFGRSYCRLRAADTGTYLAFFSLSGDGSVVSNSNCTASIGQVANGFYLCTITFTSSTTAPTVLVSSLALSTDGSTTIYAGNTTLGLAAWGFFMGPSTTAPGNTFLDWNQTGETEIEAIFNVWKNPPSSVSYSAAIPYTFAPGGVQLVGTGAAISVGNPVYVDYRPPSPNYTGADYQPTFTYAVGEQVYFEDPTGDYWKCVVATIIGQSPTTTPASWELLEIPYVFLDYCVYATYADWLRVEGRNGAAEIAENRADEELAEEFDRQERQMGAVLPTKYQTHVSVQAR